MHLFDLECLDREEIKSSNFHLSQNGKIEEIKRKTQGKIEELTVGVVRPNDGNSMKLQRHQVQSMGQSFAKIFAFHNLIAIKCHFTSLLF